MKLTFQEALEAMQANALHADRAPEWLNVVTDTREMRAGDAFLALRGENFDGHDFIDEAIQKGAAALIVAQPPATASTATLLVGDTRRAYMELARAARAHFNGEVVAITGSSGKTTTKHLLAQLLQHHYGTEAVLATRANENNEIGVSRLLLSLHPAHRVVVVEMGARHRGEIAELAAVALPQTGILTNIGDAHLEIFGSRERLAETKWGLFSTGARAILNANDATSRARVKTLGAPHRWFGEGEVASPGVWITDGDVLKVTDDGAPRSTRLDIPFPGGHNRENLAAAVAAALWLGVPLGSIARNTSHLSLPAGRYETIAFDSGPRLIYDAYNANAAGTIASLNAFAGENARRKIAVLSSMAELGPDAPAIHERVGAHAAALKLDYLLVGGDFGASLAAGAAGAGFPRERIVAFADNAQAAHWLRVQTTSDDIVLLKGSRKYRMEEIVDAFRDGAA